MNNIEYSEYHLNCLKACFYEPLKDKDQRLNIGLNVFFGNEPENNKEWRVSFKNKIIQLTEKSLESKEVTIVRKEISKENLDNIEPEVIISEGRKKWTDIKNLLNTFLGNLKNELVETKLKQTLIYEAPPYKITYSSKDKNIKFIANFIFDAKCISPYAQSIKDWADCKKNPSVILAKKRTGFFDVIPIPIPITYELRTSWATDPKFLIKGKRIFMHFFDWAVEDYIKRLGEKGITVSEKHKVAMGVPLNNAVTLYEYYESNSDEAKGLLKELLTPNDFKKKGKSLDGSLTGMWLQHYKSSIIGPGNTPLGKLIENAFS
jgi:hypothetical protein